MNNIYLIIIKQTPSISLTKIMTYVFKRLEAGLFNLHFSDFLKGFASLHILIGHWGFSFCEYLIHAL